MGWPYYYIYNKVIFATGYNLFKLGVKPTLINSIAIIALCNKRHYYPLYIITPTIITKTIQAIKSDVIRVRHIPFKYTPETDLKL